MINNGIKYSHGLQARGNRRAFLCGLKTKKSLTAGPISLSQGFTLFGITHCLLHEYAFCPYQVETKRQYRGVAMVWHFFPLSPHSSCETLSVFFFFFFDMWHFVLCLCSWGPGVSRQRLPLSFSPSLWGDRAIGTTHLQQCLWFLHSCARKKGKKTIMLFFLVVKWYLREKTNSVLEETTSIYLFTSFLSSDAYLRLSWRRDEKILVILKKRSENTIHNNKRMWDYIMFILGLCY